MAHAITMDLESVPALKKNLPQDTKAIAVLVSDLIENEAYEPKNSESAVVFLTASDIAKGIGECAFTEHEPERTTFKAHEVDLPEEVFGEEIHELDESDSMYELFEELSHISIAGGKPIWIQGAEHEGEIILQFDEGLVDMNLGDSGVMYVFKDTAFWQCH